MRGQPRTRAALGYVPALDGLRAVAILTVFGLHVRDDYGARPTSGGFLGVDIFFVLSGFLITTLLVEEHLRYGVISLKRFFARRALRLFPALVVMVAAVLVYAATLAPASSWDAVSRDALGALFYFEDWLAAFGGVRTPGLGHTWSLSVEEQFYVVWGIVLALVLVRGSLRRAAAIAAGGIVVTFVWRLVVWWDTSSTDRIYYAFDTRADSLLVGCLLALLIAAGEPFRGFLHRICRVAILPALAFGAYCLTCTYIWSPFFYEGGFTLFALATAIIIYSVTLGRVPVLSGVLESGPMVAIGRVSYGIYLWHYPVIVALREHIDRTRFVAPLAVVITACVTIGSYALVERPFLRLKDRLRAGAARDLAVEGAASPAMRAG